MNRKVNEKKEKRSLRQLAFYTKNGRKTIFGKMFFDEEENLKPVPVGITTVLVI